MAKSDKLLTGHLKKILKEKDVKVERKGKTVTITKGEALARQMVASALGYTEVIDTYDKEGEKTGTREIAHSSDRNLVKEILDRVEGKAAATGVKEEDNRPTIADKVSKTNKDRLNKMAKVSSLKI